MEKKIRKENYEGVSKEVTSERDEVISFTQTPPENQFDDHTNFKNDIRASDLFSFFTANIIKEEIVFTR